MIHFFRAKGTKIQLSKSMSLEKNTACNINGLTVAKPKARDLEDWESSCTVKATATFKGAIWPDKRQRGKRNKCKSYLKDTFKVQPLTDIDRAWS